MPPPTPVTPDPSSSPSSPSSPPSPAPRRGRRRKLLLGLGIVLLGGLIAGEIVARRTLGMGDPPLFQADPEIEYLPQPGKTYRRFGNTISYNSRSMRSPEFPGRKADPFELRVMVIGDSVVNGGALTDDADLATTLLPGLLKEEFKRPVVVGNISCGSWGPQNQLAYVERFGLFDADVVILVLNSDDPTDAPTFEPLPPELPTRRPLLALQEGLFFYVPKAFRYHVLGEREEQAAAAPAPSAASLPECMAALDALIAKARGAEAKVLIVHHAKLEELINNRHEPGYHEIRAAAARAGVRLVETRSDIGRLVREERKGYRDWIHPDAAGQRAIAELLAREIAALLRGG